LIDELTALEYSFTSTGLLQVRHPSRGHDDYPDALALAVNALDTTAGQGAPTATARVGKSNDDGNSSRGVNLNEIAKRIGQKYRGGGYGGKWK
jgi:hypothetical protein